MANISSLIRLTFIQNESLQALHPCTEISPLKGSAVAWQAQSPCPCWPPAHAPSPGLSQPKGTSHDKSPNIGGWVLAGRFESVSCAGGLFMMTDQSTKERGHAKKGATLWCEWSERTPCSFPRPHLGATPAATGSSSQQVLCSALLHAQLRSQSKNEAGKHHDSANRSMNQSMYQR